MAVTSLKTFWNRFELYKDTFIVSFEVNAFVVFF